MSTLSRAETAMVQGPPSLPDANAGETGQGEPEVEQVQATGTEAEAAAAETETETQPESASAEAGSEESAEAGAVEAEAAEAAGEEGESTAEYPEWLPWEPMKAYPEEILQLAAKKFGVPPEALGQKWAKDLLASKVNSLIQARNSALVSEEGGEEAGAEEGEEQEAAAESGEQEAPKLTVPQMYEKATQFVEQFVTPEGASLYATNLKAGFDALYDAQQSGDKEAVAKAEQTITKTNMAFLAMALRELLPYQGRQMIEQVLDGRISEYQQENQAYGEARKRLEADAAIGGLFKTGKIKEIVRAVARDYPELIEKQFFKVVNGKRVPLGPVENAMEQYRTAIKLHRGGNTPPAPVLVKKGMEAGKKAEQAATNKRELGKLAAGRATGKLPGPREESSQEYIERMKRAAEGEDPLARAPREKRA